MGGKTSAEYHRMWRARRRLLNPPAPRGRKFSIGDRHGRLVILERIGPRPNGKTTAIFVRCGCDCGRTIECRVSGLLRGRPQSCGCWGREMTSARSMKHGCAKKTAEYAVWQALRRRCNSKSSADYRDYGARGISVCERWNDFGMFIADMGPRPSPAHQIDRINNDGNYEPGNCRWATPTEQARNRRSILAVEHNGERFCLKEWAERIGISYATLYSRWLRGHRPPNLLSASLRRPS